MPCVVQKLPAADLRMPPLAPRRKLRNTFFVDTKATCFLCLKSVLPPPVIKLEDDEDGDEEMNGSAHLFQNEASADKMTGFSLRSIHKYLEMSPGSLLSRKLNGESVHDSETAGSKLLKIDLSVLLCDNCRRVTTNLADLCFELEIVQMKVNHFLETFLETLKSSEMDASLLKHFRNKLANPLEMLQASIAELMRKETLRKCSKKLNKAIPKVNLARIPETTDVSHLKNPIITQVTFTPTVPLLKDKDLTEVILPGRFKCHVCGLAFSSYTGLQHHYPRKHPESPRPPLSSTHTCNACGIKLPSKTDWIRHTKLYCTARRSRSTAPLIMKNAIQNQPSKIVTPTTPIMPMQDVTKGCSEIRSLPVSSMHTCNTCGIKLPSKTDWIRHTKLYCTARRSRSTAPLIMKNAIQNPPSTIVTPTTPIMQDATKSCSEIRPPPEPIKSNFEIRFRPESVTRRRFKCRYCGETYANDSSLKLHQNLHCHSLSSARQRKRRCRAVGKLGAFKCEHCGAGFAHYPSLWRHRKQYNHWKDRPQQPANFKSNGATMECKYFCDNCGRGYIHEQSLHSHIKNNLCGRSGMVDKPSQHIGNTGIIPPPASKPPTRSFKCEYCGSSLSQCYLLRRHQRENCPKAKAAQQQVSLPNQPDYFQHADEEEEETFLNNSHSTPKIEVVEMGQVKLSNTVLREAALKQQVEKNIYLDMNGHHSDQEDGEMIIEQQGEGAMMMTLSDTEDPLQI